MFVGRFEHTLDQKGRLVLPATFRERLAMGGYVTQGPDGCLAVRTEDQFHEEANHMRDQVKAGRLHRDALRVFASEAAEVKPDGQGRIAIPQPLRESAELTREVVVNGAIDAIEIWDSERWAVRQRHGQSLLASPSPDPA